MTDQPLYPSLYIFNVAKAGCRHVSVVPDEACFLLASFNKALSSAREKKYAVQGAIYAPTGASIFIDTDDEDWDVDSYVTEEMKKGILLEVRAAEIAPVQPIDQPSTSTESTGQAYVSIFNVGNPPYKHVFVGPNEPQFLLKSFINSIQSILDKSNLIRGAMYGPDEGANIFISAY